MEISEIFNNVKSQVDEIVKSGAQIGIYMALAESLVGLFVSFLPFRRR